MGYYADIPRTLSNRCLARVGVAGVLVLLLALPLHAEVLILRASSYVDASGALQDDALVVIQDGVIRQVGGEIDAATTKAARVLEFDGVLSPGLVDCYGALGALGPRGETAHAIEPGARAAEMFDPYGQQVDKALAGGVTAFAVCPDDQDLVGGQVAVCSARGPAGRPQVLVGAGPLKLSLNSAAYKVVRPPTSRSGAIAMLRRTLQGAAASEGDGPLAQFAHGQRRGIISVPTGADVLAVLPLAEEYKLKLALVHQHDARDVAERIGKLKLPVIVGPLDLQTSRRDATAAGVLARAGVPVAIAGGLPDESAQSLRLGAAITVRHGLPAKAARRAITSVPARVLGVGGQLGEIKKGRRADLVVFSGDPIDLRSRVLAVFVGGKRVEGSSLASHE